MGWWIEFALMGLSDYHIGRNEITCSKNMEDMLMSAELHLTAGNFKDEVLSSDVPVLVDFYADWCMPCKMLGPLVSQLAEEYKGKVKVGKVNVDEAPDLASTYNVISIPAIMVFNGGEVVRQKVGALPKHELEKLVSDLV